MPKKFQRKKKRVYPMVVFTLPDVYGEAEFVLPDQSALPLKVQRAATGRNDVSPMFEEFRAAGVDDETIDALDDLSGEEIADFMETWSNASKVASGKSGS